MAGIPLSERPDVADASWLTKAYYAMGFFVVGGLDVGTPTDGPLWARTLLWIAYFGCPLLTASAVIETVFQVLKPARWQLKNISNHIIIFGSGRLTSGYLRGLNSKAKIVVVDSEFDPVTEQELKQKYGARTVVGDPTHDYFLGLLRLKKARRVVLLGDNDFQAFEAASRILDRAPQLAGKIILHCHNLRFMRSLADTELAGKCQVFNTYNLAAQGFVEDILQPQFVRTESEDTVIVAGFGRFGQSVLEELHDKAYDQIDRVGVIDIDADRRVLVVAEQERLAQKLRTDVFQGDISHPDVWRQLTDTIDLSKDEPTIILGTGQEQENLRTALWLKQKFPNAAVYARTNDTSNFALAVGNEFQMQNISITELVEKHFPPEWLT